MTVPLLVLLGLLLWLLSGVCSTSQLAMGLHLNL